jgi:hypothetical protein
MIAHGIEEPHLPLVVRQRPVDGNSPRIWRRRKTGRCAMSVIDVGSRWRNRDRTFERAIGRHFAVAGAFVLLIVVLFIAHTVVTRDNPLVVLGIVGAALFGLTMLWKWFGGGKILLGFWLWLLSSGLVVSMIVIAEIARDLLGRIGSPSERLGGAVIAVILSGLFFLCWFGLKKAERNLR